MLIELTEFSFEVSEKASKEMVDAAIGAETEDDGTDDDPEYFEEKDKSKPNLDDDSDESIDCLPTKQSKVKIQKNVEDKNATVAEGTTKKTSRDKVASKKAKPTVKKNKLELKNEEKRKLAECIKVEDVIHNINNKLHSNGPAMSAAWQRIARKMGKDGNKLISSTLVEYFWNFAENFLVFFSVTACKAIYKSIQDSLRCKRKKIGGKSGDSGDETNADDSSKTGDDGDSNDYLAFLSPTSTKFPRKTITLDAAASMKIPQNLDDVPDNMINAVVELIDPDPSYQTSSQDFVYSYVCIVKICQIILHLIFQFSDSLNLFLIFI